MRSLLSILAASIAALTLAPAALGQDDVAYRPGYFIGQTEHRGKALVHIRGDRLTFWGQYVRVTCPDRRRPGFIKVGEHGSWPMPDDGRFSISDRSKAGSWTLRGRATPEAVTGTLRIELSVRSGGRIVTCTSPAARFTAPYRGPL